MQICDAHSCQALFGSAESEKKAVKGGVLAKIINEPVLLVALAYNPIQVFLCGANGISHSRNRSN